MGRKGAERCSHLKPVTGPNLTEPVAKVHFKLDSSWQFLVHFQELKSFGPCSASQQYQPSGASCARPRNFPQIKKDPSAGPGNAFMLPILHCSEGGTLNRMPGGLTACSKATAGPHSAHWSHLCESQQPGPQHPHRPWPEGPASHRKVCAACAPQGNRWGWQPVAPRAMGSSSLGCFLLEG